jgi:cytochrome P450
VIDYDPMSAQVKQSSHEVFSRMRAECPLHRHQMPQELQERQAASYMVASPTEEFWSVFRYDDVVRVLQSEEFSSMEGPGPERMDLMGTDGMLMWADSPTHRRQRQIANKAFLPKRVAERVASIQAGVDRLIDELGPRGRADIVDDLGIPLTLQMLTAMFGAGGDRIDDLARWGHAAMTTIGGTPEEAEVGAAAAMEMFGFLFAEIEARRVAIGQGEEPIPGALTDLILAEHEGVRFADEEILMASNQFLVAGFETTATAVGNAIWLMASYPDERKKLEQDWLLLDQAIEEILRFEPPLEGVFRTAKQTVTVRGVELAPRTKTRAVFASANRDEQRFSDPHTFRIDRPMSELRQHLAFGHGKHVCLGAALARVELTAALRTILTRLPDIRLDPDNPPSRWETLTSSGFRHVPVVWDPALTRPAAEDAAEGGLVNGATQ